MLLLLMIVLLLEVGQASPCLPQELSKIFASRPTEFQAGCEPLSGKQQASCLRGRKLFSNPGISRDGTLSCQSCHIRKHQLSDGKPFPMARETELAGPRTMELQDIGWKEGPFFWNGRASTLRSAVFWPLYHNKEIGASAATLSKFGGSEKVSEDIGNFLASLKTARSDWDQFLDGNCSALNPRAKVGLNSFISSQCHKCHFGRELAGNKVTKLTYFNLPKNLFVAREAIYASDWVLSGPYQKKVDLGSIPKSLRNVGKQAFFGRFGQKTSLNEYLPHHQKQVSAAPIKNLAELVEFITVSLQSK